MTRHQDAMALEIFAAALERDDARRADFLAEACGDDRDLRRSVEHLLESDDARDTFLEDVVAGGIDLWAERDLGARRIGAYRLVRRIGYGGMGVVYLAQRADQEFEHQVAIKVIRPGLDSGLILKRFRSERQILAGLEHPNIARLLDGGTTPDGRPYLVMEYIEGQPIDQYCDAGRLGVEIRLELFRSVCEAVQHAHQHLVIHRDLKPSNILVTPEGRVKLLDFGIARILSSDEAKIGFEPTATTDRPLTLSYASPEQVRGERVTMASDVYSLGVVLFELLTGRRPLELKTLSPQEAVRRVSDAERPAPSTVVAAPGGEPDPEMVSRARATRSERLRRRLRGDLDVIVVTALHKDRSRRYGSADQLSGDLRRHLEGRPITARPAGFSYWASKFVRRNRWPLAAAALFLALVTASWMSRAQQATRIAEERDKARQVADFLVEIFEISDPGQSRGETVTARELLDKGAERIDLELRDQPLVRAMMMDAISGVYRKLSLYKRARGLAEEALLIRRHQLGETHLDVARSLGGMGDVLEAEGDYAGAEKHFHQALDIYRELLGPASRETADMLNNLALTLQNQGRYDEAEPFFRQALKLYLSLLGESHPSAASTTGNLALLLEARGEFEEAETLMLRALKLSRQVHGEPHPEVARQLNNLAAQHQTRGNYDEAESLHRQALAMRRKVLGPDHPDVQESLNNLAMVLFGKGDYAGAGTLFRQAFELARARLGDDHPEITASASNLAAVLNKKGDFAEAEEISREVLRLLRLHLGEEHPKVAKALTNLASLLFSQEKYEDAQPLHEEALKMRQRLLGTDHPDVAHSLSNLARLHQRRGEPHRALGLQQQALIIQEKSLGEEHPKVARSLALLASIHAASGHYGEAETLYRRAVEQQRHLLADDHPDLAISLTGWGEVLVNQGASDKAEEILREALAIQQQASGADHWRTAETGSILGSCLAALGHFDEAEPLLLEGLRVLVQQRGLDHPLTRKSRQRLEVARRHGHLP